MKESINKIIKYLDDQEETREELLDISHRAIRKASSAIAALHREDDEKFSEIIENIEGDIEKLNTILEKEPQFSDHGSLIAAHREFSEALLTNALMEGDELPDPDEIKVHYKGYAQALAETTGELRRHLLDLLRKDDLEQAQKVHERMEKVFDHLERFDYPDSILSGMRHRRDVARKNLEKTRGDITRALREKKLEKALKDAEKSLED
ncbi:hypothetical protein AKJ38_01655 [candidate division MSBL1 archaeon SCGC-AAA259I14]|uniref:Haloacid dehalogenase n=1 Tax=candidate division MSBL1 archaeon SCGC-AAA259I14 TaxID=1698268 RepID=A0A133USY5_9EURY|nr:hypothetical protein AKJ38_01655 [candidate division MSBL1 archaeon SCGC-AAA259I14]